MNGLSDKVNISTGYLSTSFDIFGWPSGRVILSAQRSRSAEREPGSWLSSARHGLRRSFSLAPIRTR